MKISNSLFAFYVALSANAAFAGDCAVQYDRTACPGKEAESYAKCDGKKTCIKSSAADNEQACQALALKACPNDRVEITKSKVIKATFDGKPIKSASGQDDFCADYAKRAEEFDRCGK